MKTYYQSLNETRDLIERKKVLSLAGPETLLSQLPKGSWIGGTIPYFMTERGGLYSEEKIFATELPCTASDILIKSYSETEFSKISDHYAANGFNLMVVPAFSSVLQSFGLNAPSTKGLSRAPLIGWISGCDVDPKNAKTPYVYNGVTGERFTNHAVIMHASLDAHLHAKVKQLNLFQPGKGPTIEFLHSGYEIEDCKIDGKFTNFSEYLIENKISLREPIVSNFFGSIVNISFKENQVAERKVILYAPVEQRVHYRIAEPILDYEAKFLEVARSAHIPEPEKVIWCSNCILNYVYGNLEGKVLPPFFGPVTFGEIAYYVLNQTLVYLQLEKN